MRPPDERKPPTGSIGGGFDGYGFNENQQFDNNSVSIIWQEFAGAVARAQEVEPDRWLSKRLFIPRNLLDGVRPEYPPGHPWRIHVALVGVGRVEFRGRFWRPTDGGSAVVLVPVSWGNHPWGFDLVDLVAFRPAEPSRWYFRSDMGDVLGLDAIDRAVITESPLILRVNPLEWLRAGATDAVILDWSSPIQFYLLDVPQILTTPRTAARVRAALDGHGRCPEIRIMETRS